MATDLDLCRAVLPAYTWESFKYPECCVGHIKPSDTSILKSQWDWVRFDPEGEHFADVLAWLYRQYGAVRWTEVQFFPADDPDNSQFIDHDGSAAGIKRAVHMAALRVIE